MSFLKDFYWPRDQDLPENIEEWPIIPKLETLAHFANAKDDDLEIPIEERTFQTDIQRTAEFLERLADLLEGRSVGRIWYCEPFNTAEDETGQPQVLNPCESGSPHWNRSCGWVVPVVSIERG